jgi:PTH1 family peptidyl-tRNA hydrolase
MKLIVGLGNPEERHKNNRHNVGFMVLDKLNSKGWQKSKNGLFLYSWASSDLEFIKPLTFMNESGAAVKYASGKDNLETESLYIVHDDLDLPLGTWKMQLAKGPKEHGGINDIEQKLGAKNFWRLRIGVDNRKPETKIPGEEYVLQDFSKEEKEILDRVINEVCKNLVIL